MDSPTFIATSPFFNNVKPSSFIRTTDNKPLRKSYRSVNVYRRAKTMMCAEAKAPPTSNASDTECELKIRKYRTRPFEGQKTGTSGMRKKTSVLLCEPAYLPNWIQSLFNALGDDKTKNKTLILGGDGRFYNTTAAQTIIRMAAANGYKKVIVGKNAILTTPAVSYLIPFYKASGGIILTASHNPAGPNEDWGIKYNVETGAPALAELTDKIYEKTCNIDEYYIAEISNEIDLKKIGTYKFSNPDFEIEIIDPINEYINMLQSIFDFNDIKQLISRSDFDFIFDAMHASTGEYATRLFEDVLGAKKGTVINGVPLTDFGGGHPDPNQTYASELVNKLDSSKNENVPKFGAASDGDGDRNMILGDDTFVSPADSLSIIADYAQQAIPYFKQNGLIGVARSMPTSSSIDKVAYKLNIPIYETPTGWKFFTNLMNDERVNLCGEESFGTSSDHIREKDGLWAVMSWLSILAYVNNDTKINQFISVKDILLAHWKKYGRTYNLRYDYENVKSDDADLFMINLTGMALDIVERPSIKIDKMEEFQYRDPVDGSLTENQGIIVHHVNGGRVVFRLSGTGSAGATIRIYFETFEAPSEDMTYKDARGELKELIDFALQISRVEEFTERKEPTVIT